MSIGIRALGREARIPYETLFGLMRVMMAVWRYLAVTPNNQAVFSAVWPDRPTVCDRRHLRHAPQKPTILQRSKPR